MNNHPFFLFKKCVFAFTLLFFLYFLIFFILKIDITFLAVVAVLIRKVPNLKWPLQTI